jgi:hypothetical protein
VQILTVGDFFMLKYMASTILVALALTAPKAAKAELKQIKDKFEFIQLVQDKTLSRPLVSLTVTADGKIAGRGATWDISGSWNWKNGYFCRDLNWGGDDLGYNCQAVLANKSKIRFISDQGTGQAADFRLR